MLLTTANLYPYLCDCGLLTPAAVVNGGLHIVARQSRNRTFAVQWRGAAGVFVKQIAAWEADAPASLGAEARLLAGAREMAALAPLAALAPAYYRYDPQWHILILGLVAGEDLSSYHTRRGGLPVAVAARLGAALGVLDQALAARRAAAPVGQGSGPGLPPARPWLLTAPRPFQGGPAPSGGQAQVLGVLERYPAFNHHLDAAGAAWQPSTLIHGDLKWANCLLTADGVRLVDWEFAGWGDPAWDVGTLLAGYLAWWAAAMAQPVAAGNGTGASPDARTTLVHAAGTFWVAYREARGLDTAAAAPLLARSLRYAAVRLIQHTYEALYRAPTLTPVAVYMLQLSLNLLDDPTAALDLLEL